MVGSTNIELMRDRAAEILAADPESLAWFKYGAQYVMSLLKLIEFYSEAGRNAEADDVLLELKTKDASADNANMIARNLMRLGIYWDEMTLMQSSSDEDESIEVLLDQVRKTQEGR